MPELNDVQSRLNRTAVERIVAPSTPEEIAQSIKQACSDRLVVCPAGARHSMGGQQFAEGGVSISSNEPIQTCREQPLILMHFSVIATMIASRTSCPGSR